MRKVSARAGLRLIRNMVGQGNLAGANRLAITPGVLKKTQTGSQIKTLGAGQEGAAQLVAHPKGGIYVNKYTDPHGASAAPGMAQAQADAARRLAGPDVAANLGSFQTRQGATVQRNEYVPGVTGDSAQLSPQDRWRAEQQRKRLDLRAQRMGIPVTDIQGNPGNTIQAPGGAAKVVDFTVPTPQQQQAAPGLAQGTPGAPGVRAVDMLNHMNNPQRAGNIIAQAQRGAAPITPQQSTQQLAQQAAMRAKRRPVAPVAAKPAADEWDWGNTFSETPMPKMASYMFQTFVKEAMALQAGPDEPADYVATKAAVMYKLGMVSDAGTRAAQLLSRRPSLGIDSNRALVEGAHGFGHTALLGARNAIRGDYRAGNPLRSSMSGEIAMAKAAAAAWSKLASGGFMLADHLNEVAGLGTLAIPSIRKMRKKNQEDPQRMEKIEKSEPKYEVAGLGMLAAPYAHRLAKKGIKPYASMSNRIGGFVREHAPSIAKAFVEH